MTSISGQGWARFGLGFGAALSIIGNVAHTFLASSEVSLWLRVPFAVAWPVVLFIGIEVLVRIDWRRALLDNIGRLVIVGPAGAVAAVVSYLHLHKLMHLAGEVDFAALVGPLAIDGLMIGCTVALLAIRARTLAPPPATETAPIETVTEPIAEPAAAVTAVPSAPRAARTPAVRATPEDMRKAVKALLDGATVKAALTLAGLPDTKRAAVGRYSTAVNRLRNDPQADVSNIPGLHSELLAEINDWANRERVR